MAQKKTPCWRRFPLRSVLFASRNCHPSIIFQVKMVTESHGHHKAEGQRNGDGVRMAA